VFGLGFRKHVRDGNGGIAAQIVAAQIQFLPCSTQPGWIAHHPLQKARRDCYRGQTEVTRILKSIQQLHAQRNAITESTIAYDCRRNSCTLAASASGTSFIG
jgi:hypothetical protein